MKLLVTGAAGFIGYHTSQKLLEQGYEVVGIDNLNDYYDVNLKEHRLAQLNHPKFQFHKMDLVDNKAMSDLFEQHQFERVIHLAAQAGVRYSITHPHAYIDSNIVGFLNILEACRHTHVKHLVYASSSSVYGINTELPYRTQHNVDHPISLYAATKKSNELFAHTYSHLFGIPSTGLRFFTVYGPMGRPDMACFKFTKAILSGQAIDVYNHGNMMRDFTYIDDIVEGVVRVQNKIPQANTVAKAIDPSASTAPYKIYNIGNNNPVNLLDFIGILEKVIGKKATFNMLPMQAGDVSQTYADVEDLRRDVGFAPNTSLDYGLIQFYDWYKNYYKI